MTRSDQSNGRVVLFPGVEAVHVSNRRRRTLRGSASVPAHTLPAKVEALIAKRPYTAKVVEGFIDAILAPRGGS